MRKTKIMLNVILMFGVILASSCNVRANTIDNGNIQTAAVMDGYKILNLFSFNFVSGFINVLPAQMLPYGVTTDIVCPVNPIEDSEFNPYTDIDYLCSEVDVADYDILWLPGEWGSDNLTLYQDAEDLILDAYAEGLVMVAYNHGPVAFAHVDIVSGKNISGTDSVQSHVEAAGGTFVPSDTCVVVDSPFVTCKWTCTDVNNLYYYVALELGVDLNATPTTPTVANDIPIFSLVFISCLTLSTLLCKKKRK